MKVGIIGAMELEIDQLKLVLKNSKETKIGRFSFFEGRIHQVDVVILLSGIGKVSAAVSTTLLIEHFSPDMIINTGTAGGLGNAKVHDLILATEVRHHDVDVTAFGYQMGQQAQMPAAYLPDEKTTALAAKIAEKHSNQLHLGLVVSGDSFIHDPQRMQQIETLFPTAKAVEMEAAAIAQTCYLLNVPFIMLRAISDKAGEGNATSYEQFVNEAGLLSASINIELLSCLDAIP